MNVLMTMVAAMAMLSVLTQWAHTGVCAMMVLMVMGAGVWT
jgi:hypothetical protein